MKKALGLLGVLLVGVIVIFATVDFNRFGKDKAYVHITEAASVKEEKLDSGEILKRYWYKLPAYRENGDMTEVEFSAAKELRKDAYLMMYIKDGNEVTSYDEVQLNEIPQKAKEKLEG
ncbi:YxeA family protein [Metabacillus sp. B2-18]|uniref:YxeA family protein n=1 Tax=Metabacillus sp. B2-18 TaxID=2897333 RepID=UPI001E426884|nr:YxeA family protein [Metabacillus sp. B2-18]UGB30698.1 YxeA family protein [Metabacillus sp. B2-18]